MSEQQDFDNAVCAADLTSAQIILERMNAAALAAFREAAAKACPNELKRLEAVRGIGGEFWDGYRAATENCEHAIRSLPIPPEAEELLREAGCIEALRQLCELKSIKRCIEANTANMSMRAYYEKNKETTWRFAERVLASIDAAIDEARKKG